MIPEENSAAVTRGLREAFGVTGFEEIRKLDKHHSASLVFRMVVQGSPYLLKILTRRGDPARQFECMKSAAAAGLAPRVWHTSIEDRLLITDLVDAVPFPAAEALIRIPAALRALHALPPFPPLVDNRINTSCTFLLHEGPAVDSFLQSFRAANILTNGECDRLFAWRAQVAAAYPHHDADMVSSHNDVYKPDNILYDGRRLWLVDWEAAFRNDRYADLAVAANLVVGSDEDERVYLETYFGQPPDKYQLARFFLMQQVEHMFYTMGFLLIASAGKPLDRCESTPAFRDFHRRIWTRDVDLADKQTRILYARAHWERLQQNMGQSRFHEALRIVSE